MSDQDNRKNPEKMQKGHCATQQKKKHGGVPDVRNNRQQQTQEELRRM